jgi:hypothetical protein
MSITIGGQKHIKMRGTTVFLKHERKKLRCKGCFIIPPAKNAAHIKALHR